MEGYVVALVVIALTIVFSLIVYALFRWCKKRKNQTDDRFISLTGILKKTFGRRDSTEIATGVGPPLSASDPSSLSLFAPSPKEKEDFLYLPADVIPFSSRDSKTRIYQTYE